MGCQKSSDCITYDSPLSAMSRRVALLVSHSIAWNDMVSSTPFNVVVLRWLQASLRNSAQRGARRAFRPCHAVLWCYAEERIERGRRRFMQALVESSDSNDNHDDLRSRIANQR